MSQDFDPKKLSLGDIVVFRKVVWLPPPDHREDQTSVTALLRGPTFEVDPNRYLSSVSHVSVDPENPELLHLVGVVSVIPDRVMEWQESAATEARLRAFESTLEEDDIDEI